MMNIKKEPETHIYISNKTANQEISSTQRKTSTNKETTDGVHT